MQLTKGQKDALVRKVMAIIEVKKEAKRKELIAQYKPSKEAKELVEKIKTLFAARAVYYKTLKDLGFSLDYNKVDISNSIKPLSLYNTNTDHDIDYFITEIRDAELGKTYNKQYRFPTEEDVIDELELLNIGKSFDVDAFLAKYQNL